MQVAMIGEVDASLQISDVLWMHSLLLHFFFRVGCNVGGYVLTYYFFKLFIGIYSDLSEFLRDCTYLEAMWFSPSFILFRQSSVAVLLPFPFPDKEVSMESRAES
eukprot:scaffold26972_cov155-Skeletonema_dohrnii-CCMP3373.AAC.3